MKFRMRQKINSLGSLCIHPSYDSRKISQESHRKCSSRITYRTYHAENTYLCRGDTTQTYREWCDSGGCMSRCHRMRNMYFSWSDKSYLLHTRKCPVHTRTAHESRSGEMTERYGERVVSSFEWNMED